MSAPDIPRIRDPEAIGDLPIVSRLGEIREALAAHHSLVLEAPPGAGKTTLVPLALLDEAWLGQRRILMLQPRRIAARNAAARMAALLGEAPGDTVGYRMRLDTKVSAATRIEVITEGVLRRMLGADPTLAGVGLVIFDEFHERSLDADLSLALALHARETFPGEAGFRIVVMSATLAGLPLETLVDGPCLRSEGRQFPVDVHYGRAAAPRERIDDRVLAAIDAALAAHAGSSVLVFLPGRGEIQRIAKQLHAPAGVTVRPLYGDLPLAEQHRAIEAPAPGTRKVVLATNVAETSLTIDGVDVVIDAGLERVPVFDPNTAMTRLATARISRASAEQRRGRAGRLRPGHCYRLWSETQQRQLAAQGTPEIAGADLAPLALDLLAFGIADPAELRWLTPPPAGAWQQALELLRGLDAIAGEHLRLTATGEQLAALPLHPRLAHMLLEGQRVGAAETASLLAAVLSDRDPLTRESPDMALRLEYLQAQRSAPAALRGWEQRTQQLAAQYRRQLPRDTVAAPERPARAQLTGYLLACAYPDRIARRRHRGGYQLANGRSARFDGAQSLEKEKWLVVAEVSGRAGSSSDAIRSAAALDPALLETRVDGLVRETTRVDWDGRSGRFVAERERRIGALKLSAAALEHVSDEARVDGLVQRLRDDGLASLPWNASATALRERAALMQSVARDWPDFSMAGLAEALPQWLAPYLAPVRRLADLKKIDLAAALRARLSWEQQQRLDAWLPERITVPSGSTLRIDYGPSPPVLAVKLQEMFGCREAPVLAEGRIPLVVHLLSPAGRPLQVTRDLAGFWATGYEAVKKEMKGRYPKHPWPDDPLAAEATRFTKRRPPSA